jgi:hypothetical protein
VLFLNLEHTLLALAPFLEELFFVNLGLEPQHDPKQRQLLDQLWA